MSRLSKKEKKALRACIEDSRTIAPWLGDAVEKEIKKRVPMTVEEARAVLASTPLEFETKNPPAAKKQRTLKEMMDSTPWKNPRPATSIKTKRTKQVRLETFFKKQS